MAVSSPVPWCGPSLTAKLPVIHSTTVRPRRGRTVVEWITGSFAVKEGPHQGTGDETAIQASATLTAQPGRRPGGWTDPDWIIPAELLARDTFRAIFPQSLDQSPRSEEH